MFPWNWAGGSGADVSDSDWSQSHGVFVRAGENGVSIKSISERSRDHYGRFLHKNHKITYIVGASVGVRNIASV